jgi:hypothetical protein
VVAVALVPTTACELDVVGWPGGGLIMDCPAGLTSGAEAVLGGADGVLGGADAGLGGADAVLAEAGGVVTAAISLSELCPLGNTALMR